MLTLTVQNILPQSRLGHAGWYHRQHGRGISSGLDFIVLDGRPFWSTRHPFRGLHYLGDRFYFDVCCTEYRDVDCFASCERLRCGNAHESRVDRPESSLSDCILSPYSSPILIAEIALPKDRGRLLSLQQWMITWGVCSSSNPLGLENAANKP